MLFKYLRFPLLAAVLLLGFSLLTDRLAEEQREERRAQIEDACRFAAVSCYADEGFYPPTLRYLEEHCAFSASAAEKDGYAVLYEAIADNLMPDITVVDLHE